MTKKYLSNYDLLDVDSKDIEVDFDYNPTQLYLLISDSKWYEALKCLKENPIEARIWVVKTEDYDRVQSTCRFLPIHSACARQPPLSIVSALLQAYPEGASRVDENGMCPLHYACANQAASAVVELLLEFFPEGRLQRVEVSRALPIHLAAQWGVSSPRVFKHLLEGNQSLASARDSEGLSPIDLVVEADYPRRYEILSILKESMYQETIENSSTISSSGNMTEYQQDIIDIGIEGSRKSSATHQENPCTEAVENLQKEAVKLHNKKSFVRTSVDDQIGQEWEAVHIAIGEMDQKVEALMLNTSNGSRQKSHDSNGTPKMGMTKQESRSELDTLRNENAKFESELRSMKVQCNSYRSKIRTVEEIIKQMANTMSHVAFAHKVAIERIEKMEQDMVEVSQLRSEKLKELTTDLEAMTAQKSLVLKGARSDQKSYNIVTKEAEILDQLSIIIQTLKS